MLGILIICIGYILGSFIVDNYITDASLKYLATFNIGGITWTIANALKDNK